MAIVRIETAYPIFSRHILVVYPPLAIVGAVGLVGLWKRSRVLSCACVLWYLLATSRAHPDYLAHFNEAAGRDPGRILLDSNLDWGQDALRLIAKTRELGIPTIGVALAGTSPVDHLGLPPRFEVKSTEPAHGWIAISESVVRVERIQGGWRWLDGRGFLRVGKSIRLYHVP